jgi:hypothetical protein
MCWAVVGDDGQMVDPNLRGVNNPVLTAGKKKEEIELEGKIAIPHALSVS